MSYLLILKLIEPHLGNEIDIDNLPTFDLEYLFMNLRARSVEELVDLRYKCNNTVIDEKGEEKLVYNGHVTKYVTKKKHYNLEPPFIIL